MNTAVIKNVVVSRAASVAVAIPLRPVLLSGCLAVGAVALLAGSPALLALSDPELAFLLRGMAVIKGAVLVGAVALLYWRFGRPVSPSAAAAYVLGTWLAVGATVLIWQPTFIPAAAVLFHVGELALLVTAFREGTLALRRRAT